MRARAREVNIFNMSLIDILCGALGAFCFMMLVALPYYRPPGAEIDLRKQESETNELLKQLERLRDAAKGSALAQEMSDLIQKLQDEIKQLQGQLNQYAAQNQQLKAENDSLTKKNEDQARTISQRRPFLTVLTTTPAQEIDLYVQDDVVAGADKRSNPPFNPTQTAHHRQYWPGDVCFWIANQGAATWMVRDSPPNVHYKIYARLIGEPAARRPTSVSATLLDDAGGNTPLADVDLSPQRFWALIGTLTGQAEGKVTFQVATQAERDAEWTKLLKGATPPPAATIPPAPPPQTSVPAANSAEDRKALLEKLRQQQQRQQTPSASAAATAQPRASSGMSQEDRKALLEKLRKRQQQSQPGASPAPSP